MKIGTDQHCIQFPLVIYRIGESPRVVGIRHRHLDNVCQVHRNFGLPTLQRIAEEGNALRKIILRFSGEENQVTRSYSNQRFQRYRFFEVLSKAVQRRVFQLVVQNDAGITISDKRFDTIRHPSARFFEILIDIGFRQGDSHR